MYNGGPPYIHIYIYIQIKKMLKLIEKLTTVSRFVSPWQQIELLTRGQTSSPYTAAAK